jgi:hypothetical protein
MKATSLISRRVAVANGVFAELVLWQLPSPAKGSAHSYKYRLALVADGVCVFCATTTKLERVITGIWVIVKCHIVSPTWMRCFKASMRM